MEEKDLDVKRMHIPVIPLIIFVYVCCMAASIYVSQIGFAENAFKLIIIITVCFSSSIVIHIHFHDSKFQKEFAEKYLFRFLMLILFLFLVSSVYVFIIDAYSDASAAMTIVMVFLAFADVICVCCYLSKKYGKKTKSSYQPVKYQQIKSYVDIDSMNGEQFERYIAQRLRATGYSSVQLTPSSGDYGVDIVAIDQNGNKCAIQCKRYAKNVGVKAVQEVFAGASHYGCTRKIVVTSAYFTPNAIKLANEIGVELIDRSRL